MRRELKIVLLVIPLVALLAIFVDSYWHRLPQGPVLWGLTVEKTRPAPSLTGFWAGTFQTGYEAWLEDHLSVKPAMVRTDNTLSLLLFRDLSSRTGIPIVLGKRDTLYEDWYIGAYNEFLPNPDVPKLTPEASAHLLGRATRALNHLGIDFVVVFYPTKAFVYPEDIPDAWLLPGSPAAAVAGYNRLLAALAAEGVRVVDGQSVMMAYAAAHPDVPLFARGSTHWTDVAACAGAARLLEVTHGQPGPVFPDLDCEPGPPAPAAGIDVDLAQLLNLWDMERFRQPIRTLAAKVRGAQPAPVSALYISTSFSKRLYPILDRLRLTRTEQIDYYRHDHVRLNWEASLDHRLIVLEQQQAPYLTFNLVEFLQDLEANVPRYRAALAE